MAHSDSQNQLPKVEATLYQCSVEGKGKLPQYLPKNKLMSMSQIWFRSFLTRHDHLLNKMEPHVQKHYNHIWHNMNSIRKSMTDITTNFCSAGFSECCVPHNAVCSTILRVPKSQPACDGFTRQTLCSAVCHCFLNNNTVIAIFFLNPCMSAVNFEPLVRGDCKTNALQCHLSHSTSLTGLVMLISITMLSMTNKEASL